MIAALQLNNFYTESFSLETNSCFDPRVKEGRMPGRIGCSLEVGVPEEEGKFPYRVTFIASLEAAQEKPALDPYTIKFKIVGFFTFTGKISSAEKERMLNLNGGTILYGIIRGIVAQVTGSGQFGKYVMPAINLVEIYEKAKAQSSIKSKPDSSGKPPSSRRRKQSGIKVKS